MSDLQSKMSDLEKNMKSTSKSFDAAFRLLESSNKSSANLTDALLKIIGLTDLNEINEIAKNALMKYLDESSERRMQIEGEL